MIFVGQKFSRWTVTDLAPTRAKRDYVAVRCECGAEHTVFKYNLPRGHSKSCGCLKRELSAQRATRHGMRQTPIWHVWAQMLGRCRNPRNPGFENYGGRGITVCAKWLTFKGFYEDMGHSYQRGLSIERGDNDLGYTKSNCRWATRLEQNRNTRKTRLVPGFAKNLSALAHEHGIPAGTLRWRIDRGWRREDLLRPTPAMLNRVSA